MEPYGTRICPGVFWKGFKQAYIICLSKSVVFPSNKVELCHLNSSFSCKKCRFSADFVEVFSFGPDAFVAAPQAVETRALQLLGCHGEVMVGGFTMNSENPKDCIIFYNNLSGLGIFWNCVYLNGLTYGIVCVYIGMRPFSSWFRHGFWWLGMVSNGSLSVNMLFVQLRWCRS